MSIDRHPVEDCTESGRVHAWPRPSPVRSTERKLRVAILTTGRFYVCELARELTVLGHDVQLYSVVPPWRNRQFGLPDRCNRWLGPYLAPLMLASRVRVGPLAKELSNMAMTEAIDGLCAHVIEPCDVFIGLATMCRTTLQAAQHKYGALTFVERANRHVLSQQKILQAARKRITGSTPPERLRRTVYRELAEYQLADVITVPAEHVVESFEEYGFTRSRIFRNPFGVDLAMFPPTPAPPGDPPRLLMAGTWSVRKGADVMVEAWRRLRTRTELVHIGGVEDYPLPQYPGFRHHEPVDIRKLKDHYAGAHLFVLPSREEGMALVQLQALACGLPLVCSSRTGGADLRPLVSSPDVIRVVPPDDPGALAEAIEQSLTKIPPAGAARDVLGPSREQLSWAAHARRYEAQMRELLDRRSKAGS